MDSQARMKIAQDLEHTYLVEAGAGTGKTTLLVARILELIHTGRATLAQIVAITFTEKAADELKTRIKQKLEENFAQASDVITQGRFQQALLGLEQAQLTTIHGFCSSILREKNTGNFSDWNANVADANVAEMLYQQTWETWILQKAEDSGNILLELLRIGVSLPQLYKMAQLLTNHRECLAEFQEDSVHLPLADLKHFFEEHIEFLESKLKDCKNKEDRGYQKIIDLIKEWRFYTKLSEAELVRRLIHGMNIKILGNKKNWDPGTTLTTIKERLQEIKANFDGFSIVARHNLLQEVIAWLQEFVRYYQEAKQQKHLLDFEDLLIHTRDLLKNHKDIRGELQQKYLFILVDEFQDTDPLQVEILFFLAEKEPKADQWQDVELLPGKLFIVGDPKQSIYRFRRADIEIYQQVKQRLGPESCLAVVKNFRSTPEIIQWINEAFSHLIQAPAQGNYQPDYIALAASRGPAKRHSVLFLKVMQSPGHGLEAPARIQEILDQEASLIGQTIQQMIGEKWPISDQGQERPIAYSDIAILLRRFTHVANLEHSLQQYQIPYQVIGSKSYYSRIEIKSIIALLKAILEPYNSIAVVAALKSPIFAIADEDIFLAKHHYQTLDYRKIEQQEISPDIWKAIAVLRHLHQQIGKQSIPQFLTHIFEQTGVLFLFLGMPQGEQKVANLLKIRELAYHFARLGTTDFRTFVHWIDDLQERETEETDSYITDGFDQAVRIISIHRAKGLEFPAVFLSDLSSKVTRNPEILFDKEQHRIEFSIQGRLSLKTKNYETLLAAEKEKIQAEEHRLLYVAATRAKDYLLIPTIVQDKGYGLLLQPYLTPSLGQEYWQAYQPPKPISLGLHIPQNTTSTQSPSNWVKHRQEWQVEQQNFIAQGRNGPVVLGLPYGLARANDPILPSLAYVRRHLLYDVIAATLGQMDFSKAMKLSPDYGDHWLEYNATQHCLTPTEKAKAKGMIQQLLGSALFKRFCSSQKQFANWPFSWNCQGKFLYGQIPLCFLEANEFYLIIYSTQAVASKFPSSKDIYEHRLLVGLYSLALQEITRIAVQEAIIFFLDVGTAAAITITPELLQQARRCMA